MKLEKRRCGVFLNRFKNPPPPPANLDLTPGEASADVSPTKFHCFQCDARTQSVARHREEARAGDVIKVFRDIQVAGVGWHRAAGVPSIPGHPVRSWPHNSVYAIRRDIPAMRNAARSCSINCETISNAEGLKQICQLMDMKFTSGPCPPCPPEPGRLT